jgi:hypothetical protein
MVVTVKMVKSSVLALAIQEKKSWHIPIFKGNSQKSKGFSKNSHLP